jgi:hypothetical protein
MIEQVKAVDSLTVADLEAAPVWQYANRDGAGETLVRPVKSYPVKNLTGKVVGTQVRLANGMQLWALLGNIDPLSPPLNEHFLTLSIEQNGRWFALARYHDLDYVHRGPDSLSRFLGMSVDQIFPISYDVTPYADGDPAALIGSVNKEPRERLSRAELIAMAVP